MNYIQATTILLVHAWNCKGSWKPMLFICELSHIEEISIKVNTNLNYKLKELLIILSIDFSVRPPLTYKWTELWNHTHRCQTFEDISVFIAL